VTLVRLASQPEFVMPSLSWIVLGLIAGAITGVIVDPGADGSFSRFFLESSGRSPASGYFGSSGWHR
jgi:uncharacterized membrane protein YeaQ/YmgE (transglycosylase-associated protein family)